MASRCSSTREPARFAHDFASATIFMPTNLEAIFGISDRNRQHEHLTSDKTGGCYKKIDQTGAQILLNFSSLGKAGRRTRT